MRIFFINSDTKSNGGQSYHDKWISRGVAVLSGGDGYRESLVRIKQADFIGLYVNGKGIVAAGNPIDDSVLNVEDRAEVISLREPVEYHRRVNWTLDLRATPISRAELVRLGTPPTPHALREVHKGKERLLQEIERLLAEPTLVVENYIQRAYALLKQGQIARPDGITNPVRIEGRTTVFYRDPSVRAWVLQRAGDRCEKCEISAPFSTDQGIPYLESHHILPLSEDGSDTPHNTAALCPNCHRELHFGTNRIAKAELLRNSITAKEKTFDPS